LQIDLYVAAAGLLVGFTVGLTGMGGGALMTPLLVLLFKVQPLAAVSSDLVGTDLVQAIPLVASAAAGHLLFGDFKLGLTASLLVGSIPGVYLGAKLSSRASDAIIRPALALILIASGLKLLGVDNLQLGLLVLGLVLLAIPLWGALDATLHPEPAWAGAPVGRRMAVGVQLVGAPLGLGFLAALAYFGLLRPRLIAVMQAAPTLNEPAGPSRLLG
jgi:hypothetical protein